MAIQVFTNTEIMFVRLSALGCNHITVSHLTFHSKEYVSFNSKPCIVCFTILYPLDYVSPQVDTLFQ